ncbi:MAG: hypothetical protein HY615_17645 [Candidatus Rokubacteria bacterium]|nr:hypothetical protein [Candidatus Rokubacteria bacterium]
MPELETRAVGVPAIEPHRHHIDVEHRRARHAGEQRGLGDDADVARTQRRFHIRLHVGSPEAVALGVVVDGLDLHMHLCEPRQRRAERFGRERSPTTGRLEHREHRARLHASGRLRP